jgi:hypothetical protein
VNASGSACEFGLYHTESSQTWTAGEPVLPGLHEIPGQFADANLPIGFRLSVGVAPHPGHATDSAEYAQIMLDYVK